jgi:cytidine deaminase
MMQIDEETLQTLRAEAKMASKNAYSPYSKFKVGAAVIDLDGQVYVGCNMENASFSLTQCAERNAIAAAVSGGARPGTLVDLVVYIPGRLALPPCGACRQVMHEMMAEDSQVYACCDSDDFKVWSRDQYLPDAFEFHKYP